MGEGGYIGLRALRKVSFSSEVDLHVSLFTRSAGPLPVCRTVVHGGSLSIYCMDPMHSTVSS